jgi:hypothetical protein
MTGLEIADVIVPFILEAGFICGGVAMAILTMAAAGNIWQWIRRAL